MRQAGLTPIVLLLACVGLALPPAVHAEAADPQAEAGLRLAFAPPANVVGNMDAAGIQRLVVLLPDGGGADLRLDADGAATVANHTQRYARQATPGATDVSLPMPGPAQEAATMALADVALSAHAPGVATLVVEARSIAVTAEGASLRLLHRLDGSLPSQHVAGHVDNHAYRIPRMPAGDVHAVGAAQALRIEATGLQRVEWLNLAPDCGPTPAACPPAGGLHVTEASPVPGHRAGVEAWSFIEARMAGGTLSGTLPAGVVLAAGPVLDVAVQGALRLPLAEAASPCANCTAPAGETVTVRGDLLLSQVLTRPDGRMEAALGGEATLAAFDEQAVAPAGLLLGLPPPAAGAVAVGVGLGIWALVKLLPLLTRLREPLTHPRRREVLAYVQQRPGATFREVLRGTGLAVGSGRHHLAVLKRSGVLVERRHGHSLRYFENHGKYARGWEGQVLLREPALAALHAWVQANPGRPQKAILEAHAAAGWPARTTRSRLHRLTVAGLVTAQADGRQKRYRASSVEGLVPVAVAAPA